MNTSLIALSLPRAARRATDGSLPQR
jgi:hypothetical protein